jgi:hypothetical protein
MTKIATLFILAISFVLTANTVFAAPLTAAQKASIDAKKAAIDERATNAKEAIDKRVIVEKAQLDATLTATSTAAQKASIDAKKAAIDERATNAKEAIDKKLIVEKAQLDLEDPGSGSSAAPTAAARATTTSPCQNEPIFCSYMIGLAETHKVDRKELMRLLTSAEKGTSAKAVALIEAARKTAIFTDDRYVALEKQVAANKLAAKAAQDAADLAQAKADATSKLTEADVRQWVGEAVIPVKTMVGDLANLTAELAEATGSVTVTDRSGGGLFSRTKTTSNTVVVKNPTGRTLAEHLRQMADEAKK